MKRVCRPLPTAVLAKAPACLFAEPNPGTSCFWLMVCATPRPLQAPPLDNISIENIERIEVLKGPASALYGSDAVGGVVQIFTRRGVKGFHPSRVSRLEVKTGVKAQPSFQGGTGDVSYAHWVFRRSRKKASRRPTARWAPATTRIATASSKPERLCRLALLAGMEARCERPLL